MLRWCIHLLAVLSLMMCAATVVFWVRSYRFDEGAGYRLKGEYSYRIVSQPGSVWFEIVHEISFFDKKPMPDVLSGAWTFSDPHDRFWTLGFWYKDPGQFHFLGFVYKRGERFMNRYMRESGVVALDAYPESSVAVPYWALVTLFALLPLFWVWRLARRHFRRLPGHCVKCGYDLRASQDRCPECGTPFVRADTKSSS